jgi:hypothetical protein
VKLIPTICPPDLTDRFDFAFLCGDLNFRLDVTRLHADWLISRKGKYEGLFGIININLSHYQSTAKP